MHVITAEEVEDFNILPVFDLTLSILGLQESVKRRCNLFRMDLPGHQLPGLEVRVGREDRIMMFREWVGQRREVMHDDDTIMQRFPMAESDSLQ